MGAEATWLWGRAWARGKGQPRLELTQQGIRSSPDLWHQPRMMSCPQIHAERPLRPFGCTVGQEWQRMISGQWSAVRTKEVLNLRLSLCRLKEVTMGACPCRVSERAQASSHGRLTWRASKGPTCCPPYPLRGKGPGEGTGGNTLKGDRANLGPTN